MTFTASQQHSYKRILSFVLILQRLPSNDHIQHNANILVIDIVYFPNPNQSINGQLLTPDIPTCVQFCGS